VLVLDEPTSALDPVAAEEVLASLHRIVHDLGVTVVLAEHRLERVVHHADRVVLVDDGHVSDLLDPAEAMLRSQIYPPVVGLSRLVGWSPTPLSIRDARRKAAGLRDALGASTPRPAADLRVIGPGDAVQLSGVRVSRGGRVVLDGVDLDVARGSVTTLMGRNGAGKSTLLGAIAAQHRLVGGRVRVGAQGIDPHARAPRQRVRTVGLVPQQPELLLYADSVAAECAAADEDFAAAPGTARSLLDRISGGIDPTAHPRDLSEGQRLELALAVILAGSPEVLLLDEPTRGLDYGAKKRLGEVLTGLAAQGTTVLLATHDVELAAEVADRVVILADGEVVTDGPAREVLASSPAFAPQVTKVLLPQTWLTVAEVAGALARIA
jgi:energy-coupling factor transport system ATP-binding protein